MDIVKEKQELREQLSRIILSNEYKADASDRILQNLKAVMPDSGMVLCYVSTENEPNTYPILERLIAQKRLAVPRCEEPGIISAVPISCLSELRPAIYGIPAPPQHFNAIPSSEIAVVIVPCVACDVSCYRLGHGGGYYDRLLQRTDSKNICLCFSKLLLPRIPTQPHDRRLDCVITEDEVLWATNTVNLQ